MFRISVSFPVVRLFGLDALDFCRQYGLPDCTDLSIRDKSTSIEVDEKFARIHFGRQDTFLDSEIQISMLVPGELVSAGVGYADFVTLPAERMCQLFAAGK